MSKKNTIFTIILLVISCNGYAQQKSNLSFKENSYQRIHLGLFSSYFSDNIGIMTAGYDYGLKFIRLKPDYNLIDFGLGANMILAYGQKNDPSRERPDYTTIVPGFEVNWNIRLYLLPIKKINTRIYLEGMGMTFVYYTQPFPNNGTRINIGSHLGLGIDYRISSELRGFASLRLMHTSNGKDFARNPAINAIGITTGLQF